MPLTMENSMIFNGLSIAGIDDQTNIDFLNDISLECPFLTWGLCLSESKKGSPRYPSDKYLEKIADRFSDTHTYSHTYFCAHLCGDLCTKFIMDGGIQFLKGNMFPNVNITVFNEIQLNAYTEMQNCNHLINSIASILWYRGINLILQITDEKVESRCLNTTFFPNVNFLYDGSRGKNIFGKLPYPNLDGYIGFAGGINIDNIESVLDELCNRKDKRYFWLDLESGARTGNFIDFDKVIKIIHICKKYYLKT
jgi:hypothetical protein